MRSSSIKVLSSYVRIDPEIRHIQIQARVAVGSLPLEWKMSGPAHIRRGLVELMKTSDSTLGLDSRESERVLIG